MSTHKQDSVLVIYLKKPMMKFLMEILLVLRPKHPLVRASVTALLLGPMVMSRPLQVRRTFPDRIVMILGSKS